MFCLDLYVTGVDLQYTRNMYLELENHAREATIAILSLSCAENRPQKDILRKNKATAIHITNVL